MAQYSYNNQIEVTIRYLEATSQEPTEGFSEFVTRWRAKASMMTTQPSEKRLDKNGCPESAWQVPAEDECSTSIYIHRAS